MFDLFSKQPICYFGFGEEVLDIEIGRIFGSVL
jgi:hypothetical protein